MRAALGEIVERLGSMRTSEARAAFGPVVEGGPTVAVYAAFDIAERALGKEPT